MKAKAFVSFYHEHGVFIKDKFFESLNVKDSDTVVVTHPNKGTFTLEQVHSFSKLNLEEESRMLVSLLDTLANQHYYFLTEFGFTEKVSWTPKQYDFLSEIHPAFDINERKKEYKTFKELYTLAESLFIDSTMSLRAEGADPYMLFEDGNKVIVELIEQVSKFFESVTLKPAYEKADVVIGCGTYLTLSNFPIDIAFRVSGLDIGQSSYTKPPRTITVNPFLFYWLISSFFKYDKNKTPYISPSFITIDILQKPDIPTVNIKELKIYTYSPSKIIVKTFMSSVEAGIDFVGNYLRENVFTHKSIVLTGDFLAPFSCPSIVTDIDFEENEETLPFVDSTPYGQIIYEVSALPKIAKTTRVGAELFDNPIYNKEVPLVLDTNVIDIGAFPYDANSPFFKAFMEGRTVLIPSIVIYELMRKIEVGKEKQKVIRALVRLWEYNSKGLIKLEISDEPLPFEAATHEILTKLESVKKKESKSVRSDIRDSLIIQNALRVNGVIFTNDRKLRALAILLGVPSISYNPLIDDIRTVIQSECKSGKISKERIIKLVKEYALETRAEKYSDEDITLALSYLRLIDKKLNQYIY